MNTTNKTVSGIMSFASTKESILSRENKSTNGDSFNIRNLNKSKKYVPFILLLLILFGVAIWAKNIISSPRSTATDEKLSLKGPRASQQVNKEFSFPLKNDKNQEVAKFKYLLSTAELRDEILVKSQRVVSVNGKVFLILTIKITNSYSQAIDVNAKDYVRVSVNGNDKERLAADIHNDPVTVQALSTKETRLGFPINDSDKNLVLYIGELTGDKTKVDLKLK